MASVTIMLRKGFPRRAGMGAAHGTVRMHGGWGPSTTLAPAAPSGTAPGTPIAAPSTGPSTSYRSWRRGQNQVQSGQSNQNQGGWNAGQGTSSSTVPSASTLSAFQTALANAGQLGVISTTQVSTLQAEAANATDAQLQSLTAQLNALVASAPSTLTTAASAAATVTPTNWWDESTSIAGYTIQNSTLAISAVLLLGLGYFFMSKKR